MAFRCIEHRRGCTSWWLNQQGSSLPQFEPMLIRHFVNCISKVPLDIEKIFPLGSLPRRKTAYSPAGVGNDPDLRFLSPFKAKHLISLFVRDISFMPSNCRRLVGLHCSLVDNFHQIKLECLQSFVKQCTKKKCRNMIDFPKLSSVGLTAYTLG